MKSWGERLVTGLKNWRSRKGEAAPEQTPDAGLREQLNPESIEQSLIGAVDFDQTSSAVNQKVDPADIYAVMQITDEDGEPNMLQRASDQPEQIGRESIKPSTPTSRLKSPAKQSATRTLKHGGQLTTSKDLSAQQEASVDEAFDEERLISDDTSGPNQELPKQFTGKVSPKDSGGTGGKSAIPTGSKSPSGRLVAVLKAPQAEEATNENATILVVPVSPQKYSRKRKPKTTDERVTDAQLAALEAENARLKRLLREKLSAKQDNSES
ncbi:hypothetical protein [Brucella anthropi]|uniref:hypothetical protein n=1 Tax=Brucella anthropi TaxID=529 RepID=UPI00077506BE|nr:hypothetical protein [Brucella anthropi]KXO72961.1 hypothetical protein AYJ56_17375 [Brucella anthropi]